MKLDRKYEGVGPYWIDLSSGLVVYKPLVNCILISWYLSVNIILKPSKPSKCQTIIELCAPQHHNNYRKIIIHPELEIIH